MTKIAKDVTRTPLTHIPRDVATRVLANPKNKISNKSRKRFLRALGTRIEVEIADVTSAQEKYCAHLRGITLHSLGNQLTQAERQIKRLVKVLALLDCHAREYATLDGALTLQRYRKGWIEEEIARRCTAKPVLPKKESFPITAELDGGQGVWFAFAENEDEALLLVAAKGGYDPKKKPREVTTAEGFACWGDS